MKASFAARSYSSWFWLSQTMHSRINSHHYDRSTILLFRKEQIVFVWNGTTNGQNEPFSVTSSIRQPKSKYRRRSHFHTQSTGTTSSVLAAPVVSGSVRNEMIWFNSTKLIKNCPHTAEDFSRYPYSFRRHSWPQSIQRSGAVLSGQISLGKALKTQEDYQEIRWVLCPEELIQIWKFTLTTATCERNVLEWIGYQIMDIDAFVDKFQAR